MRHFNYYAAAAQKFKDLYALKFDGDDDYLQSATNAFQQWAATEPFTIEFWFFNPFAGNFPTSGIIFTSQIQGFGPNGDQTNRYALQFQGGTNSVIFQYRGFGAVYGGNILVVQVFDLIQGWNKLSISCDGATETFSAVLNGQTKVPTITKVGDPITQNFVSTNTFRVGRNITNFTGYINATIAHLAFTNTAESIAEMQAKQASNFSATIAQDCRLLVKPIYPTYIKTLDSTQTFEAFQGGNPINMSLFGYPNPLVLDTNLIKI